MNALKRQFPTCFSIHFTCPCNISSIIAGSNAKLRVVSFFRRLLCIVRKRPLQMWRFFGLSVFSSATSALISGRSFSDIDTRLHGGTSAVNKRERIFVNLHNGWSTWDYFIQSHTLRNYLTLHHIKKERVIKKSIKNFERRAIFF